MHVNAKVCLRQNGDLTTFLFNEVVDHINYSGNKNNMNTFTCHMFWEVNPTVFLSRDDPGVTRHGHTTCSVYDVESKALTTLSTVWRAHAHRFRIILGKGFKQFVSEVRVFFEMLLEYSLRKGCQCYHQKNFYTHGRHDYLRYGWTFAISMPIELILNNLCI